MPFGIGITEMVVLLGVLLLVFGPKRLPEMGRSLGKGVRELREGISGDPGAVEGTPVESEPRP
jgi:sec-independent protein translocase protein TatA